LKVNIIKSHSYYIFIALIIYGYSNQIEPPFNGTIFIDPDIINEFDPSCYVDLKYQGCEVRTMYDRREDGWIENKAYLFPAKYDDGFTIEIQVNSEFKNLADAQLVAEKFAYEIGKLPNELRKNVETVWIHKGMKPFGGGNNNILIHTDWSKKYYEKQGILEETLIHEAAHTSLDQSHAKDLLWIEAQKMDGKFISQYAKDNPVREDIAESYLPYFALRYRRDRISESLVKLIEDTIPNRIFYFDNQKFQMYPVVK
tara:strand:+ start:783 stop:1550 length:768 start_codon:yes stop_codon:yes gene_type:complete